MAEKDKGERGNSDGEAKTGGRPKIKHNNDTTFIDNRIPICDDRTGGGRRRGPSYG